MRKYILSFLLILITICYARAQERTLSLNKKDLKETFISILKKINVSAYSLIKNSGNAHSLISYEEINKENETLITLLEKRKKLKRSQYKKEDILIQKSILNKSSFDPLLSSSERIKDLFRRNRLNGLLNRNKTGSHQVFISGNVLVNGTPITTKGYVGAFDTLGFFANLGEITGSGSYSITELEPGKYYVRTLTLHVDEFYDDIRAETDTLTMNNIPTVLLQQGKPRYNINFNLLPGAKISGTVRNGSTGKILNPDNAQILEETTMDIFPLSDYPNSYSLQLTINENGKFEFYVGNTDYVKFRLNGIRLWDYTVNKDTTLTYQYYKAKDSFYAADSLYVPVVDGSFSFDSLNFSPKFSDKPSGAGKISGFLLEKDGITPVVDTASGISNLTVIMLDSETNGYLYADTTLPDTNGYYKFTNVPEGRYKVYVTRIFGGFILGNYLDSYFYNKKNITDANIIELREGESKTAINFLLRKGGTIGVKLNDQTGTSIPPELSPSIRLRKKETNIQKGFPSNYIYWNKEYNDKSETYYFPGAEPGEYSIQVFTDGYVNQFYKNIIEIGDTRNVDYISVAEAGTTSVEMHLEKAGKISGRITDPAGMPFFFPYYDFYLSFVNLTFYFIDPETETRRRFLMTRYYNLFNGDYYLAGIPEGKYKILLEVTGRYDIDANQLDDPFYYLVPEFFAGSGDAYFISDADTIAVSPGDSLTTINFKMDRSNYIKGMVRDNTGNIPGFSNNELGIMLYTNDGRYVFSHSVLTRFGGFGFSAPGGNYKIHYVSLLPGISSTYYAEGTSFSDTGSMTISIDSTHSENNRFNFNLVEGSGTVSGTIRDTYGGAVPYVYVAVYDTTGHLAGINMSGFDLTEQEEFDPDYFSISNLSDGVYYVRTFANLVEELFEKSKFKAYNDTWYGGSTIIYNRFADVYNAYHSRVFKGTVFVQDVPENAVRIEVKKDTPVTIDITLNNSDATVRIAGNADNKIPSSFGLSQNFPNPFNQQTVFVYRVPVACTVTLDIYNTLGQHITTLIDEEKQPGEYRIIWYGKDHTGKDVPSGLYFYKLNSGNFSDVKKMILLR